MKTARLNKIVELIEKYDVTTQEQLGELLRKSGFEVTQATVSRDIRELGLSKVTSDNGLNQKYFVVKKDSSVMNEKYIKLLRNAFISHSVAQNLVVIKTISGMAMGVAAVIDSFKWDEVAGCIAGDDTIFCAIRDAEDADIVIEKLDKIINGN